jgi:3-hydroxyisobutyrate dehydrogenase-like beta-hydroxyacid dehydrogenase
VSRCIGIVHPGAMGSEIGRTLSERSIRVVVGLEGRSERTKERAALCGLEDVGALSDVVRVSDLILSIVPPASALEVAAQVARCLPDAGRDIIVVDANAISPTRAARVAETIEEAGGHYVDGGIIGGPPRPGGRTDLVLSGPQADALASDLTTDELVATSIGPDPTAASALKMCYAAWSKGTSALLISIRAVAQRHGVDEALVELWGRTQSALVTRSDSAGSVAGRAWRWVDEMTEIARTFEDAGQPGGAAAAASLLYERLASFKDIEVPPSLAELIAEIRADPPGRSSGSASLGAVPSKASEA